MNTFRLSCLVVGLVVAVVAGCGSDAGSGSGSCQTGCATALSLKCAKDTMAACVSECEAVTSDAKCGPKAATFAQCSAGRPASDFECDMATGTANLKDGICDAEAEALLACAAGS